MTDGERLYAFFGSRGLFAYDMDGEKLWEKQLVEMEIRLAFGEGSTPALHGDTLVVQWDHEGPSFLVALDGRTGEAVFGPERLKTVANVYASPVAAAGRVYIVGRDGETEVIEHGPEYEVLATNVLDDRFDASPALAEGEIYLRGAKHLYCIAENDDTSGD